MNKGRVKFFNTKSSFGFIAGQDGREYYVHAKDLLEEVKEGDEVVYELKELKRGPAAIRVRKVQAGE